MYFIKKHIFRIGLLIVVLITLFTIYYLYVIENRDELTVAFLDVGQGDSIFIEAPNGNQVLIDAGSDRKVLRKLNKVMPFFDRTIDVVIATHPDRDHIGGIPDVLKRFIVNEFIEPGVKGNTGEYDAIRQLVKEKKIISTIANQSMSITLDSDSGIFLHIIFPDRAVYDIEKNTSSIVTHLIYGETEFMLTGDSPKSIEKYLVSIYGEGLESDVLKAGHHGSKTSSSIEFLEAVDPEYVVVSAGKDNQYGHPHIEVTKKLNDLNIETLATYEDGTIIFKSDGKSLKVK